MTKKAEKAIEKIAYRLAASDNPKVQKKFKEMGFEEVGKPQYVNRFRENFNKENKRIKDKASKAKKKKYMTGGGGAGVIGALSGAAASRSLNPKKLLTSTGLGALTGAGLGLGLGARAANKIDKKKKSLLNMRNKSFKSNIEQLKDFGNEKTKYYSK